MKIKCTNPDHEDRNASMELYPDAGWCFVCGHLDRSIYDAEAEEKPKENIEERIREIKSLPKVRIRELEFHADRDGYYIIWPDGSYYKKRLYNGKARYIGPRGHKAPLLVFKKQGQSAAIIEGEINALSLATVFPGTIISPGSATELNRHLDAYTSILLTPGKNYSIVNLIVDKDPAGVAAGLTLKKKLIQRGMRVTLIGCEKDCNEILQQQGPEGLKAWVNKNLEMPRWV